MVLVLIPIILLGIIDNLNVLRLAVTIIIILVLLTIIPGVIGYYFKKYTLVRSGIYFLYMSLIAYAIYTSYIALAC